MKTFITKATLLASWGVLVFCASSCNATTESIGDQDSGFASSGEDAGRNYADSGKEPDSGLTVDSGSTPDSGFTDTDTDTFPEDFLDWVFIDGGTYSMGNWDPDAVFERDITEDVINEFPAHNVTIPGFYMWRTEVTVRQYDSCVNKGDCEVPLGNSGYCTYGVMGKEDHPTNCVSWYQARQFCKYVGGRLPSESEWEYTARNRGADHWYPWGNSSSNCDFLIMDSVDGPGCGAFSLWPVCSKPAGNTELGLCDMSGNVYEWVEDWFHPTYAWEFEGEIIYAPSDGSPWLNPPAPGNYKVMRGGGINSMNDYRTTLRIFHPPDWSYGGLGFRCARST